MAVSTPMRYCNPSEAKPKVIIMPRAVILLSRADPVDCPDSFRPADWLQPTTSLPCDPAVTSTNRYRCMTNLIPLLIILTSTC